MPERRTQRPVEFSRPTYWRCDPPPAARPTDGDEELSPTRYGDWVRNGVAVDF